METVDTLMGDPLSQMARHRIIPVFMAIKGPKGSANRVAIPFKGAHIELLQENLRQALQSIPPYNRMIFVLSYGLYSGIALTERDVGRLTGIHKTHIANCRRRTLEWLREPYRVEILCNGLKIQPQSTE